MTRNDHLPPPFVARLPRPFRQIVLRPRLALAVAVFVVLVAGLPTIVDWHWPTVVLAAWNGAVGVHLALVFAMMANSDERTTLRRARRLDEGALTVLAVSTLAGTAGLLAVVAELAVVKDLTGLARIGHVALTAATVLTAWTFIQVTFALHYAHDWWLASADGRPPCLHIPGEDRPDYWDFLYVAMVIGTSGQTADVEFTAKRTRRVGLVHCALAFFFNTTVLALTINIAASLIS